MRVIPFMIALAISNTALAQELNCVIPQLGKPPIKITADVKPTRPAGEKDVFTVSTPNGKTRTETRLSFSRSLFVANYADDPRPHALANIDVDGKLARLVFQYCQNEEPLLLHIKMILTKKPYKEGSTSDVIDVIKDGAQVMNGGDCTLDGAPNPLAANCAALK